MESASYLGLRLPALALLGKSIAQVFSKAAEISTLDSRWLNVARTILPDVSSTPDATIMWSVFLSLAVACLAEAFVRALNNEFVHSTYSSDGGCSNTKTRAWQPAASSQLQHALGLLSPPLSQHPGFRPFPSPHSSCLPSHWSYSQRSLDASDDRHVPAPGSIGRNSIFLPFWAVNHGLFALLYHSQQS